MLEIRSLLEGKALLSAIEESEPAREQPLVFITSVTIGHRGIWTEMSRVKPKTYIELLSAIEESELGNTIL